jgi:hypothetical protein
MRKPQCLPHATSSGICGNSSVSMSRYLNDFGSICTETVLVLEAEQDPCIYCIITRSSDIQMQ